MIRIPMVERFGPVCGTPDEADRLRGEVRGLLERGDAVCLDFTGVTMITGFFLNAVIGELFGEVPADVVTTRLTWSGLDEAHQAFAQLVQEKAQWFFSQPPEVQARLAEAYFHPVEHL